MQQLIEFGLHHWQLWLAFFILLGSLLILELHGKVFGIKEASPQQITLMMNREDAVILDLRTTDQFNKGYITGAVNIPLADLDKQLNKLEPYKTKPIILVYNVGKLPHKVAVLLQKNGFNTLRYLHGGVTAWQNAGLPLVKGK